MKTLNRILFSVIFIAFHSLGHSTITSVDSFLNAFSKNPANINVREKEVLAWTINPLLAVLKESQALVGLSEAKTKEKIDSWKDLDLRKGVMQSEAFFKLYSDFGNKHEKECLEEAFNFVKTSLEDPLGVYIDHVKTANRLNKFFGENSSFESPSTGLELSKTKALAAQQVEINKSYDVLLGFLKSKGWMGPETSAPFKKFACFVDVDWPNKENNLEYLVPKLSKEAKKIEITDYEMSDLHGGVHELRRDLRTLFIELETTSAHVKVAPALMKKLSQYVAEFGDIKDNGEIIERFVPVTQKALALTGRGGYARAETFVHDFVEAKKSEAISWLPQAEKLYKTLKTSTFLKDLQAAIEANL